MVFPDVPFCENTTILNVIHFFRILIDIMYYAIPLIIIVVCMIELYKDIVSPNSTSKMLKEKAIDFLKRIILDEIAKEEKVK